MFPVIYAVLILIGLYLLFLRIEKVNHEKRVKSIPIRIWVNGTRGKSSVTRLIAAGLRGGGKRVIAKTTGTKASFIVDNKTEQPVMRLGMPNIREQVEIVKQAMQKKPDAIVLECMALRPDLQYSEAVHIVKPTAVVITNVRADHLDVMGPSTSDIARYFLSALPRNSTVFLGEPDMLTNNGPMIRTKNVQVHVSDAQQISDSDMKNFPYIEHKANVALALEVCRHFNINKKEAIAAMCSARPDPGVLRKHSIEFDDRHVVLVNAMAANDPDSTYLIWQMIDKNFPEINILVNCRNDRIDRSFQMAELIDQHLQGDRYILTGSGTEILAKRLYKMINRKQVTDLGNRKPEEVVRVVSGLVADKSLIFAIGNTVGYGEEMMLQFLSHKRK